MGNRAVGNSPVPGLLEVMVVGGFSSLREKTPCSGAQSVMFLGLMVVVNTHRSLRSAGKTHFRTAPSCSGSIRRSQQAFARL